MQCFGSNGMIFLEKRPPIEGVWYSANIPLEMIIMLSMLFITTNKLVFSQTLNDKHVPFFFCRQICHILSNVKRSSHRSLIHSIYIWKRDKNAQTPYKFIYDWNDDKKKPQSVWNAHRAFIFPWINHLGEAGVSSRSKCVCTLLFRLHSIQYILFDIFL